MIQFKTAALSLSLFGLLGWAVNSHALLWGSPAVEDLPEFITVPMPDGDRLSVSRYEVTLREWNACVADGDCEPLSGARDDRQDHPAVKISWFAAQSYISWYQSVTGKPARLPSREEWLAFSGQHAPKERTKLFDDPRLAWAADYDMTAGPPDRVTQVKGSHGANDNGLFDIKGNVWKWTSTECGDPETSRLKCRSGRFAMGEHQAILSDFVSDPGNASCGAGQPPANLGFRLVY